MLNNNIKKNNRHNNNHYYNEKKIAFLLLTYEDHIQADNIKDFLENGNIYVHPKYPDKVNSYLKNYIIDNLIETKWGDISIVEAELNLLKESFNNINNQWFILMSDTCFPLMSFEQLYNNLFNIKKFNFNSFLFLTDYFNKNGYNYYKSSQFWILNRNDVELILNKKDKYIQLFNNFKHNSSSAYDELFFLTLLMNEYNLFYKFNNIMVNYNKWINFSFNKHPFYINKLTEVDENIIQEKNCFFVRKITNTFTPNYITNLKKNIVIIYIDSDIESNKNNKNNKISNIINKYTNDNDIIIFYSDNAKKYITNELISMSILCINVIYKIYKESYILFKINNADFFNQWSNILFEEIYFK